MHTTTVVIGAGQGGLAMSRCLSDRSIDHVVLERSQVANSWRTERWDSLRLLTPNWQCRLPGYAYDGDDPDGFMTMPEVVDLITGYAKDIAAPVQTDTTVTSVRQRRGWLPRHDRPGRVAVPDRRAGHGGVQRAAGARASPRPSRRPWRRSRRWTTATRASSPRVACWSSARRRPGVQIAHEIQRSGRPVTLAVGEHVRGPRDYRGRDIHWWMEAAGVLDERYDEVDDIVRARRVPSMQLAGSPERASFDLNALTATGVTLVGRLAGIRDGRAQLSGSLRNKCDLADLKLGRLLDTIDEWATANGIDDGDAPPHRFAPTVVPEPPALGLDLTSGEIQTDHLGHRLPS